MDKKKEKILALQDIRHVFDNRSYDYIKERQFKSIREFICGDFKIDSDYEALIINKLNYITLLDNLTIDKYNILDLINHRDILDKE